MAKKKETEDDYVEILPAKSAAENEAEGAEKVHFVVEVGPKKNAVSLEAVADIMDADAQTMVDMENHRYANVLHALLGQVQFDRLRAAGMSNRDMVDVVLPAWQEVAGVGED